MRTRLLLCLLPVILVGCADSGPDLAEDAKSVPKLSKEEAEKYRNILPGSRKSQQAQAKQP